MIKGFRHFMLVRIVVSYIGFTRKIIWKDHLYLKVCFHGLWIRVDHMVGESLLPSDLVYANLLSGYCNKDVKKESLMPSDLVYANLLSGYCNKGCKKK